MPPKHRKDARGEDGFSEDLDFVASPVSDISTDSARTSSTVTTDQLEQILASNNKAMLEANHQTLTALLASLSTSSAFTAPKTPPIKVPKWSDDEIPSEYFKKLEKALQHNGVDKAKWGELLPVYLTGKAQAAFAQVDPDSVTNYEAVKNVLLESLGDTPASADRKWWSLSRLPGEDASSFYLRIRAIGIRKIDGLTSREEILEHLILSRFLSLLPSDGYGHVVSRRPKNGLEAARIMQEHEKNESYARKRQPWRRDLYQPQPHGSGYSGGNSRFDGGSVSGNGGENKRLDDSIDGGVASGSGPQESSAPAAGQSTDGSHSQESLNVRQTGRYGGYRKQITCYGCGEPGHVRSDCPYRIRNITEVGKEPSSKYLFDGFLNGVQVEGLRLDSGTGATLVRQEFIPSTAYTGKSVRLDSWQGGRFSRHRLARIRIKIGEVEELEEVVAVSSLACPALLGNNIGSKLWSKMGEITMGRLKAAMANSDKKEVPMQPDVVKKKVEPVQQDLIVKLVVPMQQEVDLVKVEEEKDAIVVDQNECDPLPFSGIFDFSEGLFEDDPVPGDEVENSVLVEDDNISLVLGDIVPFSDDYFEACCFFCWNYLCF